MSTIIGIALISIAASMILCGALGGYVSKEKNRPEGEGIILGVLFGLIGVVIAALLPTLDSKPQKENKAIALNKHFEKHGPFVATIVLAIIIVASIIYVVN